MKKTLLSFLMLFMVLGANATESIFLCDDPKSLGYAKPEGSSGAEQYTLVDKGLQSGDINIDVKNLSTASSSNSAKFWNGSIIDFRAYKGGSLTFSSTNGENIVSIELTGNKVSNTLFTLSSGEATTVKGVTTWVGNADVVTFSITATMNITKIVVKTGSAASTKSPKFSIAPGTYWESQSVELSSETEGADIYYTVDETEPTEQSTKYTSPINVTETTLIKALAILNGEKSTVVSAQYNIANAVNSLTDWKELEVGETSKINVPLTVAYYSKEKAGEYLYVKHNDDYMLIYGTLNQSYENGDILPAGIVGKKDNYNGLIEFLPDVATMGEVTKGGPSVDPIVVKTTDLTTSDMNKFVIIRNVTVSKDEKTLSDENSSLTFYQRFAAVEIPEDEQAYNVKGFVAVYKDAVQIYPTAFEVAASVSEIENNDFDIISSKGVIEVVGDTTNIEVYTIGGKMISQGKSVITCSTGLYIVKANGKVARVIVK